MDESQTINTIIFDVGNVLVNFDWERYLDSFGFSPKVRRTVASAMFLSPQWDEMDRSLLTDQEYLNLFIQNAPQYQGEVQRVYENCDNCIQLYDYADSFVLKCRENGCRTYILSNYSRYVFHKTEHKMSFRKYMDGEIFSFQTGQIKPEPEIYHSLLEKYSIDPRRALFLDDRQVNLNTASQLHIHTLLFTSYPKACKDLKEMGILD